MINPIAYAIPVFFAMIGGELWLARRKGRSLYRFSDAVTDLGCGVLQQTLGVFTRALLAALYFGVYARARVVELDTGSALAWLLCFLAVDHQYYWFHRMSHQVNFLWLGHVVHHQSEDYNLAVALRQSAIQPLFSIWFYLPLAVLGFPPLMFFVTVSLNTLYQFWIHTELVDRVGPLERLLNTPSHHRVHHGRNPQYIDKNHAGMLIVWDKLYGTFEPEGERLIYGLTRPVRSWNVVWSNLQPWRDLYDRLKVTPGLAGKLRVLVEKPGWVAPGAPEPGPGYYCRLDDPKYDVSIPDGHARYGFTQFVLATGATIGLLVRGREGLDLLDAAAGLYVVATLVGVGGILDARGWARSFERARLAVSFVGAFALRLDPLGSALALGASAVFWLVWVERNPRGPAEVVST